MQVVLSIFSTDRIGVKLISTAQFSFTTLSSTLQHSSMDTGSSFGYDPFLYNNPTNTHRQALSDITLMSTPKYKNFKLNYNSNNNNKPGRLQYKDVLLSNNSLTYSQQQQQSSQNIPIFPYVHDSENSSMIESHNTYKTYHDTDNEEYSIFLDKDQDINRNGE